MAQGESYLSSLMIPKGSFNRPMNIVLFEESFMAREKKHTLHAACSLHAFKTQMNQPEQWWVSMQWHTYVIFVSGIKEWMRPASPLVISVASPFIRLRQPILYRWLRPDSAQSIHDGMRNVVGNLHPDKYCISAQSRFCTIGVLLCGIVRVITVIYHYHEAVVTGTIIIYVHPHASGCWHRWHLADIHDIQPVRRLHPAKRQSEVCIHEGMRNIGIIIREHNAEL